MSTLTIQLPDEKHDRLRALAARRGVSIDQLTDELLDHVLAQQEAESRFRVRAAAGSQHTLTKLLDKLDAGFAKEPIEGTTAS